MEVHHTIADATYYLRIEQKAQFCRKCSCKSGFNLRELGRLLRSVLNSFGMGRANYQGMRIQRKPIPLAEYDGTADTPRLSHSGGLL